ncbi:hypothetical protein BURK1_02464 [Burkholderiales bacterium]|nr:hypothetical protein BURK1_02464 [Burkholderiales bacterium]
MARTPPLRRLAHGAVLTLDDARGATVRVRQGQLWVTQYGDPVDHVLEAGDAWVVGRGGRTVVQAQRDSLFELARPVSPFDRAWRAFARIADPLGAWLRRATRARLGRRWAPYV